MAPTSFSSGSEIVLTTSLTPVSKESPKISSEVNTFTIFYYEIFSFASSKL